MIVFYGKGKVGTSFQQLCDHIGKICILMDDADRDEVVLAQTPIIVPTPGISQDHDIYTLYKDKIVSELDMCYAIMQEHGLNPHSIGVTGTDGKSTVTWLISQSLAELLPHYHVHATGNWDDALSKTILDIILAKQEQENHLFVIECSSFMLYPTKKYHFDIGVRTNFAPDHLNWHPDMDEYFAAKQKLLVQSDTAYVSKTIYDMVLPALQKKTHIYPTAYDLRTTQFIGEHNEKNCALTFEVVKAFCAQVQSIRNDEEIRHAIGNVKPLKHRMQRLKTIEDITWYDDGKSTSAQSLGAALHSFAEPIIVICGGSDKGDSFDHLADLFKQHAVHGVFLGQTAPQFAKIFDAIGLSYTIAHSMQETVSLAWLAAKEYSAKTILFSPGCASFDMFKNYEDRAHQYIEAVQGIGNKE